MTELRKYHVEFMAHVYVMMTVAADSPESAKSAADMLLPRYPVVAEVSDAMPEGVVASVAVGKDWEINSVEEETE